MKIDSTGEAVTTACSAFLYASWRCKPRYEMFEKSEQLTAYTRSTFTRCVLRNAACGPPNSPHIERRDRVVGFSLKKGNIHTEQVKQIRTRNLCYSLFCEALYTRNKLMSVGDETFPTGNERMRARISQQRSITPLCRNHQGACGHPKVVAVSFLLLIMINMGAVHDVYKCCLYLVSSVSQVKTIFFNSPNELSTLELHRLSVQR